MNAHTTGLLLLSLAAIIGLARLFGMLAKRVGQPPVVGEIVAGILVGPSLLGATVTGQLVPAEVRPPLAGLANVGLVLFMFIVGYELDHTLVRDHKRVAISVSAGSIIVPMGLGVLLALWLAGNHDVPRLLPFALFLGAAMSVTAFPVLARILTDRGMHRGTLGGLALASAAVDDVVAWSLLAVVVTIASAGGGDQWHLVFTVPYLLVMFLVVRPLLRRLGTARQRAGRLTPTVLVMVLVGLLLSCYVTEWLGVHAIFGAFLFGAFMPRAGGEALRYEIIQRLEQVAVLVLLPTFFVLSGMRVDLSKLDAAAVLELCLILAVAIVGKFAGAYAGARLQKVPARQAGALATLMNTRGLTEVVILSIGLELGILDDELFSLMVVMALVTTAMAGPVLSLIYPKQRIERDAADAAKSTLPGTGAYRVLVVVPEGGSAAALAQLGSNLIGDRRPAEVVLSRLLPYRARDVSAATGLSGDLLELTRAMEGLARLAGPLASPGVATLARFSTDAGHDLTAQLAAKQPDVVVAAADQDGYAALRESATGRLVTVVASAPPSWRAVHVRAGTDAHGTAAVAVGAELAAAHSVELVLEPFGRAGRRLAAVAAELTRRGLAVRISTGPLHPALVVVPEGVAADGAHLEVRSERDQAPAPRPSARIAVPA